MPHGANHAKQIVIDEASALAHELQNGNGADPQTQGKAIGLIVKMITPLYEAELVTVQECEITRERCRDGQALALQKMLESKGVLHQTKVEGVSPMKVKFMGVEVSGTPVTSILLKAMGLVPFCVLFYMMAKLLKWF